MTLEKQHIPGFEGNVHVNYCGVPAAFEDVITRSLDRKLSKLVRALGEKEKEGRLCKRVLLLELSARERGNAFDVKRIVAAHRKDHPKLEKVDEIWVADLCAIPSRRWDYLLVWPNGDNVEFIWAPIRAD